MNSNCKKILLKNLENKLISFSNLFGKPFSKKLKEIKQTLVEELEKHNNWYQEFKKIKRSRCS